MTELSENSAHVSENLSETFPKHRTHRDNKVIRIAEAAYEMHLQGYTNREIAKRFSTSDATISRAVALKTKARSIDLICHPENTRTVAQSVDEKRQVLQFALEVMSAKEKEGDQERPSYSLPVRLKAGQLVLHVSESLDGLFGIDDIELRRQIYEIRQKLDSEEGNR